MVFSPFVVASPPSHQAVIIPLCDNEVDSKDNSKRSASRVKAYYLPSIVGVAQLWKLETGQRKKSHYVFYS